MRRYSEGNVLRRELISISHREPRREAHSRRDANEAQGRIDSNPSIWIWKVIYLISPLASPSISFYNARHCASPLVQIKLVSNMITRTRLRRIQWVFAACFAYAGCAPVGEHPLGEDKYGCNVPPPDTFTSAGVDVRFAQSMFGKVVTGDVNVRTNPSVVSLVSQAVRDARIRDYVRCLSINRDKFTHEQVLYLDTMTAFMTTSPSPEAFLKWQEMNRFPSRSKAEVSEQEANKPKVEITFNGLSQKELQANFPLPLVLDPSLTATLSFVVTNIGDGPVLNPLIAIFVEPRTISVDRPGPWVHETRPNHHRYEIKGRTLLPKEMSDASYEFIAAVKVPEGIDALVLLFKIVGDNLRHNDLALNFKAIHYKRPEGG